MPKPEAFVAHGGGPTAVLNSSLLGVVHEANRMGVRRLWAGRGGLAGLLGGEVIDLLAVPLSRVERLAELPGSMIGSFRGAITDGEIDRVIAYFRRRGIRYCFYAGGNGSMGTARRIAGAAANLGYELFTVGIPKTVDNDICGTDHCPGFGSAARFVATAVREIGLDQRALPSPISIVEVMGRNAGWLAAASILARRREDDPPHFLYIPERPFDLGEFVARVEGILRRLGWVVGVVAEGLRDARGKMIGASGGSNRDARGRALMGDVAARLARVVSRELRVRARSEKPGLLCRAFSLCRSRVDAREAYQVGRFAVKSALAGHSEVMVAIERQRSSPYRSRLVLAALAKVSERERLLPARYLQTRAGVHENFRDYVRPLIGDEFEPAEVL